MLNLLELNTLFFGGGQRLDDLEWVGNRKRIAAGFFDTIENSLPGFSCE